MALKLIVITVVVAITWLALYVGTGVLKVMGRQGSSVVSRIMGLIIGAIAVRFIREGLEEVQRPR
jgi:small neutral amino acid transporter SnatA (MarC family)